MKLLFKQRLFSWFDSYDIYDESGNTIFTVKGQLSWGHCLKIFDAYGNKIGTVQERVFSFLPRFEIYIVNEKIGCITKEFSFLKPKFQIDYNGWQVEGDFFGWDYRVYDRNRRCVAEVSKQLCQLLPATKTFRPCLKALTTGSSLASAAICSTRSKRVSPVISTLVMPILASNCRLSSFCTKKCVKHFSTLPYCLP